MGIAITGQTTATGTWQYRLSGTKTFLPIDPVDRTHALLLRPTDALRFVPAANANGLGELTFKTWLPDANFGTYVDATAGGTFGASGGAAVPITPVNDAPVLNATLHPDLGTVAAGQITTPLTVAALLVQPGLVTDVDSASPGIQLMPVSVRVGKWQYFDVATNAWKDVKLARKLAADVQIRFQAAAGAVAGTYGLTFKAWDGKLVSKVAGTVTLTIG
jgi:hypothetical protein